MRRVCTIVLILCIMVVFIPPVYAARGKDIEKTIERAEVKFKEIRKAYILAKKELSDAQIDALLTVGKTEKQEAVERVQKAREKLKAAKKAYVEALHELHKAEVARDAKRVRPSPWK